MAGTVVVVGPLTVVVVLVAAGGGAPPGNVPPPPVGCPVVVVVELVLVEVVDDDVSTGAKVKLSANSVADFPAGAVTVMSTVPAFSAGLTAMIELELLTVKLLAAVPPKLTRRHR